MTDLSKFMGVELAHELDAALERIEHCLGQLTDAQVWWRPTEAMNSIGNLLLHLAGNVRQYVIHGLGGAPDTRHRPGEFSAREPIAKSELLARLRSTLDEAKAVLVSRSAEDWKRVRRVQSFELSGLRGTLQSVAHFRGHTQEIIHLTRTILGDAYRYAFVPATKEQGAP